MRISAQSLPLVVGIFSMLIVSGCESDSTEQAAVPKSATVSPQESFPAAVSDTSDSPIRLTDITAQTGIDFVHHSGDNPEKPFPAANGSGIGALDYDRDGWNDLLFLNGADFPLDPKQTSPTDRFYQNRGGMTFRDRTKESGLGSGEYSAGVACGDFNNDGFPDVFVNCFGENLLYCNQGDGTFQELAAMVAVSDDSWGTSAAWLDFDGDGDLDLYACNYAKWTWETNQFCGNREKQVRIFCSPRTVKPAPDRLFENLGDGTFRDVLSDAGLARESGRGQGVIAADIDDDGLVDLYVGNDINANFLFRNRGDRTFEDLSELSGTAHDFAGRPQAGMGVDVADIDRDGQVEIFVTNYENEHNAFYKNLGNRLFQDVSQASGLSAPSVRWVGWGTSFSDFDLDGWTDLVVTNGHTDDNLAEMGQEGQYDQPPLLFHNEQGRLRAVAGSGDYFQKRHPGRALCPVDLDGDGDLDLVIGHQDQPPAILRNDSQVEPNRNRYTIDLSASRSNRDGIGAKLRVTAIEPELNFQINSGGSYLTSKPFGTQLASPADQEIGLEVRWPDGKIQTATLPSRSGKYQINDQNEIFVIKSFPHH